jgi:biotin carboxyl carrier protein
VVLELEHDAVLEEVRVHRGVGRVLVGDRSWTVRPSTVDGPRRTFEIEGVMHTVVVEQPETAAPALSASAVWVAHQGQARRFTVPDRRTDERAILSDGLVTAPMPGLVRDVRVRAGQHVEAGDVLGILEAMKMETALTAPHAGAVEVQVRSGDQVTLGQTLFTVGEEP